MATTKFGSLITNSDSTLASRAKTIEEQARVAQNSVINDLSNKKSELELQVVDLLDFSPESKDSLRPGRPGWNAKDWAEKLNVAQLELYKVNIALTIAEKTYDEYFTPIIDVQ